MDGHTDTFRFIGHVLINKHIEDTTPHPPAFVYPLDIALRPSSRD